MVNFAELKAKAEKAKDVTVTKVTDTRDRMSSTPSSRANWDPNWKRAPPTSSHRSTPTSTSTGGPPLPSSRTRPDVAAGTAPPPIPRASRPTEDLASPPPYTPPPPPRRAASGYPPGQRDTSEDAASQIDWANLGSEDKEVFFGWLDEFFSRHLGIDLVPRERRSASVPSSAPATLAVHGTRSNLRGPPSLNMTTRPQV